MCVHSMVGCVFILTPLWCAGLLRVAGGGGGDGCIGRWGWGWGGRRWGGMVVGIPV